MKKYNLNIPKLYDFHHPIMYIKNKVEILKCKRQRIRDGYCWVDLMEFDIYILKLMKNMLADFSESKISEESPKKEDIDELLELLDKSILDDDYDYDTYRIFKTYANYDEILKEREKQRIENRKKFFLKLNDVMDEIWI